MDTYIKSRRGRILVVCALAISVLGAGVAYARHIASYDLIVPRFGSAVAYTHPLTKVNYSRGVDNNRSIGGGRSMYSAIYRGTRQVTPRRLISSGSRVLHSYYSGQNQPGTGYRLGHRSRFTEPYRIQTRGSWSPDER